LANTPDSTGEKFVDIEKGEPETVIRPQIIKTEKSQYHGGMDYDDLCQTILREFQFRKEAHRIIFSLHSEGKSERDIQDELKRKHSFSISQKGINLVINRVKEQFLKG
jgi:hypothetical protein